MLPYFVLYVWNDDHLLLLKVCLDLSFTLCTVDKKRLPCVGMLSVESFQLRFLSSIEDIKEGDILEREGAIGRNAVGLGEISSVMFNKKEKQNGVL